MSNNIKYWGKRFGACTTHYGCHFKMKKWSNGKEGQGKGKNTAATKQSIHDKKSHADLIAKNGIPVIYVKWKENA